MSKRLMIAVLLLATVGAWWSAAMAAESVAKVIFARKNLIAWCIVPFDSKKRGPEERAAMLEKLGFRKFAYDYRAEHIPTFDAEIEALKRHNVELSAWWFPTSLNDEAKMTLEIFAKHKVTPQLWVTGGGSPTKDEAEQKARVAAEADRIRPIAQAAAKVGCKVALYNHGGWFGEPENQIAIIQELKLDNVGIVYNLHHGHDHLDRFAELLKTMKPHLYALNLNGMVKGGDRTGQKILQLGQGDLDLKLLTIIRDSGYTGPIGILGHTQDDAEQRLQDNLDGLDWLIPQVSGEKAGPKPKPRTPVPQAANAAAVTPRATDKPLVEGRFGQALDGRAGGAFVAGRDEFRQFPLTVECWTRLKEKGPYNILVAHELKSSGTHWEMFSMAGNGNFTAYVPGFAPDHCYSNAMICDDAWHHVAMVLEPVVGQGTDVPRSERQDQTRGSAGASPSQKTREGGKEKAVGPGDPSYVRIRLYVDGKQVADQQHKRADRPTVPGGLAIGSLIDRAIGCTGLIDEVRISKSALPIADVPTKPFDVSDSTVALWRLDELVDQKRFTDASPKKNDAVLGDISAANPAPPKGVSKAGKIEGHWGEDAIGFRWTESDSRDDRFGNMDSGPIFSGSITGAGGPVYKGIVVRIGDKREASVCYDTELLRVAAGWRGFIKFDPARFGIIVPPRIDGDVTFATPRFPGVTRDEQFPNYREKNPYGPLPKEVAHYEGLFRHGKRVVLKYTVGSRDEQPATILESPWLESAEGAAAITRTLLIGPTKHPLRMILAEGKARVRVHPASGSASVVEQPGIGQVLVVAAHEKPVAIKLLMASADTNEAAFEKLSAASPAPEDLLALTKPGPTIWDKPLVTKGEVAKANGPDVPAYVVDTITLPFDNPYGALFFCGGHDFLSDGRAAVCTLHGDVWLVDGIDASLQRITWRRFATGLFQPLGLKIVRDQIYVTGRDQITRLIDSNGDGEADQYENFNNDAHVTLNGHEYVTCLETDRAGNFYYVKGNCNSQTPHDGSMLRVSADGSRLDVFATGFRNPNGMGMGPNDEITVAPQEGEWTPASAVFVVKEGGFYGGMMSHHRAVAPTDFDRPLVWFPRLADNSSGGQVWTTSNRFGPLSNQLLHMSYGQCRLRLVLSDEHAGLNNGASMELPLRFTSGIHRGRMSPHDGQLYLTGLKGWTTSAVHDGCFQRVRYTGGPVTVPIAMKTFRNGIEVTFSGAVQKEAAEEPANYRLEAWNYKWSAAYGSPEYKPSAPNQIGRDEIEPRSATLMPNERTVFLEIPNLAKADQLAIGSTQFLANGQPLEQEIVLTLNSISAETYPSTKLNRKSEDPVRAKLLASLVPGIQLYDQAHGKTQASVRRMLAWDDLSAPEQLGDPSRTITATGWLRVPSTGRYRFFAVTSSPKVFLQVGQHPRFELPLTDTGFDFPLTRGVQPITVTQLVGSRDNVEFRLMWESDRIPREGIPATLLMRTPVDQAPADRLASGAALYEKLRCANCHIAPDLASPRRGPDVGGLAPQVTAIGSRLKSDWLAHWIRDPHSLRNDTTMPAVLPPTATATANDIAAYLASLQVPRSKPHGDVDSSEAATTGEDLFEQLGCIACHTFKEPKQPDTWNRVSLYFVGAKYHPAGLVEYLLKPHAHFATSRMPDFHLTESEASSLAEYLNREAKGRIEARADAPGNAERGRLAFTKQMCVNCHRSPVDASMFLVVALKGPQDDRGLPSGCLSKDGTKSPQYRLDDGERAALTEYYGFVGRSRTTLAANRPVDGWITELRCYACHTRDARQSILPEIIAEEGSGRPAEAFPQLTWVGEKLQGPWIEKLLKGEVTQKPRPWIKARMPSFPAYASVIAHGMAAEHGVEFAEPISATLDPGSIESGRLLTLRDGGLDCRQCHGVGKEQPRGDAATQIALGINFAMTKHRLRPEFALRQMLDPPRYDIGSRMPRFAPDLRTTAARQIADGDARKQFEMLKQYLWSVKEE